MVDHISPERRSWLMSRVRGKHTTPEMRVRKAAHAMGLRFRLHRKDLPGKPDLVFPRHRVALFVHGCFWHRHAACKKSTSPKTRVAYWNEKFRSNVERDRNNYAKLSDAGWTPLVIWECQTKSDNELGSLLVQIIDPPRQKKAGSETV